jgi:HAD superfamily hydrolase (TIGR01549 family)
MSYRYILFDYDGCLADTVNCWAKAINKASVEFGLRLNEVQIRAQFGGLGKVRYHGLSEERVPTYVDRVKALARGEVLTARLHDGAYELLLNLSEDGKRMAVVSNNNLGLNNLLIRLNIRQFFETVLAGEDVKEKKPSPEGIERALGFLRCTDRKEAIMIGDSEHDLGAAKNAGIDSILFYPTGALSSFYTPGNIKELEVLYKPKHTVRSHFELREILCRSRC